MKKLLIFFILLINSFAYAQDVDKTLIDDYIDKAISAIEKNDFKTAKENFQIAFEFDEDIKNSPEINYYYAKLCMLDGNYNEALEKMLFVLELNPDNPVYYIELGKIYLYKKDYLKAVNAFQYALSGDTALNGEIYNYLGIANYKRGDIKTALENFQHADEINNNNIIILTNLLYCYKGLNMEDKIKETYERITDYTPKTPKDYLALSRIYFENKKLDECKNILKEGIKNFPDNNILKEIYSMLNKT